MDAFKDIKVIEFAWFGVGPYTTQYLAQHGAVVIKVESTEHPDSYRLDEPFTDGKVGLNRGGNFALANACKYGITLDLAHPKGRDLCIQLIRWADVVVQAFPPGSFKRLKLEYDDVKAYNPEIIYLTTCLQGRTGPHANLAGLGPHLAALSGFTDLTGWPDRGPTGLYGAYTDFIAFQFGVIAVTAALHYRQKTGKGQHIDQSQYESSLQFLAPQILDVSANHTVPRRMGYRHDWASPHGVFPCRGRDQWIAVAVFSDDEWRRFCESIELSPLVDDERFAAVAARKENEDELERLISARIAGYDREDLTARLQQAGVCAGPVETVEDLHQDRQLAHRGHFQTLDHPEMGETDLYELTPFRLSETPCKIKRPAPCLGEHNEYVFTQILKLNDETFASLVAEGVIG